MKSRGMLLGAMAVWLTAACSVDSDAPPEGTLARNEGEREPRVKDRVIEVVCDPDSRATPQELVPLVREVRERDGRSDRVWEVADQADCIAGPQSSEKTPTDKTPAD